MVEKKRTEVAQQLQGQKDRKSDSLEQFPIVGIGASAGGLAAFKAFFAGLPSDVEPNMAFILVQHLAPDHKSILTEIVRQYTRMKVFEVVDRDEGVQVRMNCAYIIPPNHNMAFVNGKLHLSIPTGPRGQPMMIDFFFRSLAVDQGDHAIGIILSGTGSDGTLGVRAIKGEGGMVMVQSSETAEFDGMPNNAIATGLVDYQLNAGDMGPALIAYAKHGYEQRSMHVEEFKTQNAVMEVFRLLREQTNHDFSQYKPNTVNRRIERRMAVHQIDSIEKYVVYLQRNRQEVEHLFRDLLIGVTHFFRDNAAFDDLETQVIAQLFDDRPLNSPIRVWVAGCSTGEEAYSIAILIYEKLALLKKNYEVQIFATDIDPKAIETARRGLYPASVAVDISSERLSRFFIAEGKGEDVMYRLHKNIRDMLIFSAQDIIRDPPFSKLDLISCRNLLIYLNTDLQHKVIPMFHYALNSGGFLFLGSSEGINDFSDLFTVKERQSKIFRRKENFHAQHRLTFSRLMTPSTRVPHTIKTIANISPDDDKVSLRALTEQTLLKHIKSACALVNAGGDIFYLFGRTGMYLEPSAGETSVNNILKMARQGLQYELSASLHQAALKQVIIHSPGLRVKTNGDFTTVNLTIRPTVTLPNIKSDNALYLVILDMVPVGEQGPTLHPANSTDSEVTAGNIPDDKASIAALMQELQCKEEYLHATNEELEVSNEELKSSNEEMQSINEELQSSNEELETSKEELQSVNEELSTVNVELQSKMADLTRANNDMNNLLAGTGIATVFVDLNLRIMRFTPAATSIINLIASDVGRPLAHIVTNLHNSEALLRNIQAVLDTLIPSVMDVETISNKWFTMRILPYRTLNNSIEGAVLTFVDITEAKHTREALQQSNDVTHLGTLLQHARDAITVQDLTGQTLAWNHAATQLYGWSEEEALSLNVQQRIPKMQQKDALNKLKQLSNDDEIEPYRTQRLNKAGLTLDIWITTTALLDESGELCGVATMEQFLKGKSSD